MNNLLNYIEQFVKLDEESVRALEQYAEIEQYAKNQNILEYGQRCNKIWFLQRGMVRKFYLHDGKEVTTWLHTENEIFTSLRSYSQNTLSEEYLQACENTIVVSITKKNSEKLISYAPIVAFTNIMMEREFVNIDTHTKELNSRDARGKYEYLQSIAPEIIKRAKLGHIASVLGISQETLSRIRRG
jgi:signal-transduction protein with cAMP-binding, CBS, and nucleotidyltransferase domain